jgi:hypothetical protein
LHELADKFGQGVGNAEQLIQSNLARMTPELRRAELLPRDPEETAKARKKLVGQKKDGHEIKDAAVRGGTTCVVVEDETGRYHLAALDDNDKLLTEADPDPLGAAPADAVPGAGPQGPTKN